MIGEGRQMEEKEQERKREIDEKKRRWRREGVLKERSEWERKEEWIGGGGRC